MMSKAKFKTTSSILNLPITNWKVKKNIGTKEKKEDLAKSFTLIHRPIAG